MRDKIKRMDREYAGDMPKALPGFEKIKRYWDCTRNICATKILPGEYYVSKNDEVITTVLGSCVAACIREPVIGIGGMNHFMLPLYSHRKSGACVDSRASASARYGNVAMEQLISKIIAYGGRRENLEIKLFGGGKVLNVKINIGQKNIDFVKNYLIVDGLKISSEDLGGVYPRKVVYFPASGRVSIKKLYNLKNRTIMNREKTYYESIMNEPISADVEFFKK